MAVDFTQNRDNFNDRCKYYKKTVVSNMKLTVDSVVQGVFYTRDSVPQSEEEIAQGNIKRKQYRITIETPDIVSDLETDDFILYVDDNLWRVNKVVRDDKSASKEFSKRPSALTTIEMVR